MKNLILINCRSFYYLVIKALDGYVCLANKASIFAFFQMHRLPSTDLAVLRKLLQCRDAVKFEAVRYFRVLNRQKKFSIGSFRFFIYLCLVHCMDLYYAFLTLAAPLLAFNSMGSPDTKQSQLILVRLLIFFSVSV